MVDLIALYAVLLLISKEEVGAASVAWTIAVVVETANGMGIGVAILQAPKLIRGQLDSAFWYIAFFALSFGAATVAIGPLLADFYDEPRMVDFVWAVAAKLIFVSAFTIPYQLLNRELRYREIAAVKSAATLLAAIRRG